MIISNYLKMNAEQVYRVNHSRKCHHLLTESKISIAAIRKPMCSSSSEGNCPLRKAEFPIQSSPQCLLIGLRCCHSSFDEAASQRNRSRRIDRIEVLGGCHTICTCHILQINPDECGQLKCDCGHIMAQPVVFTPAKLMESSIPIHNTSTGNVVHVNQITHIAQEKRGANHCVHLLLCCCTGGLWCPCWFLACMDCACQRPCNS
eukprot:g60500.t1